MGQGKDGAWQVHIGYGDRRTAWYAAIHHLPRIEPARAGSGRPAFLRRKMITREFPEDRVSFGEIGNLAESAKAQDQPLNLMTPGELAKALRVSEAWIRDHASGRRRPVMPSINLGTDHHPLYRFDRKVIQEWLNELAATDKKRQERLEQERWRSRLPTPTTRQTERQERKPFRRGVGWRD